jgi:hypothetical protein
MKIWFPFAMTAAAEKDLPLWESICLFLKECFVGPLGPYEHLNMGTGSLLSVRFIVIGIFLGLAVGSFVAVFNKQVLGSFVRTLLSEECLSPEDGRTLPELNLADKLTLRRAVRHSVTLRRVVRCREEEEFFKKQEENPPKKLSDFRIDPDTHHFYIPEDLKYTADVKFEAKGTTWPGAIIFSLCMVILMMVALVFLPDILQFVNNFVGSFQG